MINMGMSVRKYWALAGALGFAFFLTACGDLGMVLPSQGSYRVNAQVDGDYTLDTYSVVAKKSKIRPYFVNSVVNDPDVRGLTVFVQDYSGDIVSRKVQYQLPVDIKETQKPVDIPEIPAPAAPAAETVPTDVLEEVSRDESPENEAAIPGDTENDPQTGEPEFPEEPPGADFGDSVEETPAEFPTDLPAEVPADLPVEVPMDLPVEVPTDLPVEVPADSFDETGNTGLWAATGVPVETEPEDFGGADTTYTSGTVQDTTGANTADRDTKDTDMADTDTPDINITGADAVDMETPETDTAGIDTASTDTTDINTTDTKDATDTGIAGTDTPNTGTDDTDITGTDIADTDTTGEKTTGTDIVDTDTTGTKTASTDTAKTPPAVPAPPPVEKARLPVPEDEIVPVKQLDQYLPAFQIVEQLDIGRYNLVFQVMGEKEILYRTYKPIYFIGDAKFTLGEIQSFLPVAITGGRLIPPGINVMLGTEIDADPRLDPYIIWHNGKKTIAQGRLSDGANYLLWKTPAQTGFHSIRAEVFPLLPGDRMPGNMLGKIKELSLPVSSKSEGLRSFSDPSGEFINWYQLWGTLDDAKAPNSSERRLISQYAQAPLWTPFGGMYGLLIGRDDSYTLPGMPFKLSGDAQGTGRILLHFAALSEGSILNIRFAGGEIPVQADLQETAPAGTADMDLSYTGEALILRIASGDVSQEESLELNDDGADSFITVTVEFTIARDHLDAELRLKDPAETTGPLSIVLAAPISGEGTVHLGSSEYSGYKLGVKRPASGKAKKYNGTMVLNELALSYTRLPFPKKEEESESGLPESLTAVEETPDAEPELPGPNAL
jgi:hypothetical protein